ncbi:MAG: alpha-amylase family glycosyl hydrolase, partial [Pseudomonadota bacterium]
MIPRATYRLQLNLGFTFQDATRLVPYLAALGISHVYCSPYFRARPGSQHGYDIVDHNSLNPELGTRADFDAFVDALRAHDMGHIVDFVPNHVGIMGSDNAWWTDVLENGRASRYGDFFDIDWAPPNPTLANKLLVPVLGGPYGSVLEACELRLQYEAALGSFAVFYHEHRFPLDPCTYPVVLETALLQPGADLIPAPQKLEFESLAAAFRKLPSRGCPLPEEQIERDRDKELHKRRLATLLDVSPALRDAVEAALRLLCGNPADPHSVDALHQLLEQQVYRLAYWRVASDDINYRRFFDVNSLAALRMENPRVFEATHGLLLELLQKGQLDGVRLDHPDGLYDPLGYFTRLQEAAQAVRGEATFVAAGAKELRGPGLYLLVEKILASFERLPTAWPVHGTTGYNFANVVNGVFVDGRAKTR